MYSPPWLTFVLRAVQLRAVPRRSGGQEEEKLEFKRIALVFSGYYYRLSSELYNEFN